MPPNMRTWIQELEAAGELVRIPKPVDPVSQMGALLYQSRERALLFEQVARFPGWRTLGIAPANPRHAALAFGTPLAALIPHGGRPDGAARARGDGGDGPREGHHQEGR